MFVFAVKYEVQDLEADYTEINRSIERERQSIHVLLAEWSHLNEPARIRELAREHLGLEGLTVGQVGDMSQLPMRADPLQLPPDRLATIQAVIQELTANGRGE